MQSSHRLLVSLATAVLLALTVSGVQARVHAPTASAPVKIAAASILTNASGLTLYVFAPDKPNKSTCNGKCAVYWPPVPVANGAVPVHVAGVPGTFGAIMRTDGTHQLTYDGAPLYTFLEDKKPGQMNGQGLMASGGYWWVVVAAGGK